MQKFINSLIEYTELEFNIKPLSSFQKKRKIYTHFCKSQKIIFYFFFFYLMLLNCISLIFFLKKFSNIKNKSKKKLFLFLKKFSLLKVEKIEDLIHALLILNNNFYEKINKIKLNQFNFSDQTYIENIVIGSGPSGTMTALQLKKSGYDTLVVEKGSYIETPKQKHCSEELMQKWSNGGLNGALGSSDFQFASAKCVGGGSEINSGLYHEPDQDILKKVHGDKYNSQNTFGYLDEIVSYPDISKIEYLKKLAEFYNKSANKLGWKISKLKRFYNSKINKKNSMTETYLNEFLSLEGKILSECEVNKIKVINDKKILITIKNKKKVIQLFCKNLYVCCGAPYTSFLLKENKLLPKKTNHNFHFHPMYKIVGKFPEKINHNRSIDIINEQITEFMPKYIFGNAASGKQFLLISTFGSKEAYDDVNKNYEFMSIFHSTFSLGKSSFLKVPLIDEPIIKYKLSKDDYKIIIEGIKNLVLFTFNAGAEYIYLTGKKIIKINKNNLHNLDTLLSIDNLSLSSVHLLGGLDVNDSNIFDKNKIGKLKNHNIYVNDSSLITGNLLKNPQGTIMEIAKRNIQINT